MKKRNRQPVGSAAAMSPADSNTKRPDTPCDMTPLTATQSRLVERHIRLARGLSWQYREVGELKGIPLADLEQEACWGLCMAAQRYDAQRGVQFSTYAYSWVKKFILKALSEQPCMTPTDVEQLGELQTDRTEEPYDETPSGPELDSLLGVLGLQERKVVCLIFGLAVQEQPAPPMNFRQVARQLHLSPARVHQIYNQALTKMELAQC